VQRSPTVTFVSRPVRAARIPRHARPPPRPGDDVLSLPAETGRASAAACAVPGREVMSMMMRARYEIRVNGHLSERARSAFCPMEVQSVPPQTIVFGELDEQSDLCDLLALCSSMGVEVVSLERLPD
jgi:hypothetical protein